MLLVYHDVVDPEICDALIREHETSADRGVLHPEDAAFDDRVLFLQRMSEPLKETTARIALEIGRIVGRQFQTDVYPETVSVVRWEAGDAMAEHRDGQNPHTINRSHAVVLYLNEQTSGGEIYFPEIGTVISPKQALLVAYEKTLLHGVRPVEQPRYTLTLWYSEKATCSVFGQT